MWWNVTAHRLWVCEDNTNGAAVWRQVWPTLATDLSGTITNAQLASADGWIAAPALTYVAADAPVYTATCAGDYSAIIMAGMRIKLIQGGSVKYFIVVKSEYSAPNTTLTLYGGTNYTLGATITYPYYSMLKAPAGFPLSPAKWTVELNDVTDAYQNTPVNGTIYNISSLSLAIPIGVWNVFFQVMLVSSATSGNITDVYGGVSSSVSSFNNQDLRGRVYVATASGGAPTFVGPVARSAVLTLAAKTTYYIIAKTDLNNQSLIGYNGASDASTVLRAVCAYL
jgi:hypothetical protein